MSTATSPLPPARQPREPAEAWRSRGGAPPPVPSRSIRVRRTAMTAAVLALLPALVSWVSAMTGPSNATIGIKTVEWMRDNGARGLVNRVENIYYSLTAPSTGGPGIRALPAQPGVLDTTTAAPETATGSRSGRHTRRLAHHFYKPHSIRPVIHPALAGEGVWRATYAGGGSRPPVLVTSFRPEAAYPSLVAGVAWLDHTRTSIGLYPGLQEPAVTMSRRGPAEIPSAMRPRLVATFNSGFKLSDSGGGFIYRGTTLAAMHAGIATFVRYASGKVDVIAWPGAANLPARVAYARQNLPLIVNHGRPNPNLSDGPEWGATLGNAVRVWRSAVGIDRRGNILYAAAPEQTVASLAGVMIRAGAVRAMELDINTYWTSFISYRRPGAVGAANLLATMDRSTQRYLSPDDRDFFAVYRR